MLAGSSYSATMVGRVRCHRNFSKLNEGHSHFYLVVRTAVPHEGLAGQCAPRSLGYLSVTRYCTVQQLSAAELACDAESFGRCIRPMAGAEYRGRSWLPLIRFDDELHS